MVCDKICVGVVFSSSLLSWDKSQYSPIRDSWRMYLWGKEVDFREHLSLHLLFLYTLAAQNKSKHWSSTLLGSLSELLQWILGFFSVAFLD